MRATADGRTLVTDVIAHRGDSAHAPENTLRAFESALAKGADRIELDVQRSADGVPFVFHDIDLERLTGVREVACSRPIDELTALQVLPNAFGSAHDTRIPTLDTVLAAIGALCPLYVEIKADGAGRHADDWIHLADACIERVDAPHVLASFALPVVRRCLAAGRPTVLIASDPRRLGELTPKEQSGLHAVSVLHERITASLVATCRSRDLPLWAWTVDRARDVDRLRSLGADAALCTNDPGALRALLDARASS